MKSKRKGSELQAKTFDGNDGKTYMVFRSLNGSYHAFVEIEAKEAARNCGAMGKANANTRKLWSQLWDQGESKPEARAVKERKKQTNLKKRKARVKTKGDIDFTNLNPNIAAGTEGINNLFRGITRSAGPWLRAHKKLARAIYKQICESGSDGLLAKQLSEAARNPERQAAYRLAIVGLVKADTLDKDVRERRYYRVNANNVG